MSTSLNSTKPCDQDHPQLTHRRTTAREVAREVVSGLSYLELIF